MTCASSSKWSKQLVHTLFSWGMLQERSCLIQKCSTTWTRTMWSKLIHTSFSTTWIIMQ
ncbi:hypothetical protein LINPERHAP1_LOCUS28225, partial [Linum perenne]